MQNRLKDQTSPYLLQHAENPVDWYPWCEEAFNRAKREDKPIFLSIGYSTCHWCHVMAHESFEDEEIAEILNQYFVSIKVDKEERPDIDSIYMSVCQALTGSGGWPTTIFLTPEQRPFFAGTYFPKTARYGRPGLKELLLAIRDSWRENREELFETADKVIRYLERDSLHHDTQGRRGRSDAETNPKGPDREKSEKLIDTAFRYYQRTFDAEFGGFGREPKFPTPHNLLFLLGYDERSGDKSALNMVEKTLLRMYRGGMFDHIGGGFSRYSTDRFFLVPHFEKMLYDNALLMIAYSNAFQKTKKTLYREVAEKTAAYVLREMTAPDGGFYSAQDADSEGVEGKYYLFEPAEIIGILGVRAGSEFNAYFDITEEGNFEGKNIPNRLKRTEISNRTEIGTDSEADGEMREKIKAYLPMVYEYRRNRYGLHLDDKILTSWNGLMIAAMCQLYRITGDRIYLDAARKAWQFIENNLCRQRTLYVSYREGRRGGNGFLDDYAFVVYALLALYEATLDRGYLGRAVEICEKTVEMFGDEEQGGFFLYGQENEQLILRPKETYDGAVFSGNSAMAWNLVRLHLITEEERFKKMAEKQLRFMCAEAEDHPAGHSMFLMALSDFLESPDMITIAVKNQRDPAKQHGLSCRIPLGMVIRISETLPLKDDRTTFYLCQGHSCQPPINEL